MSLLGRIFAQAPTAPGEELCTVLLPDASPTWSAQLSTVPRTLHTQLRAKPFERNALDVRFAQGIARGAAHVSVHLSPFQHSIAERTQAIRDATELACRLVDGGAFGVVLHAAGDVLLSGAEWSRRTQRRADPQSTPALAWTDLGHADGLVLSYGMSAFGLPEVGVLDQHLPFLGDDEAWHRAQEAALAAICTMAARGSALADNEVLSVIAGTEFGGAPLSYDNLGLDEVAAKADTSCEWRCEPLEGVIRLVPPPLVPLAKRFELLQGLGMMPYPSYRWLFLDRMRARGYEKIAYLWPKQIPGVPAHEVLVLEHSDGGRFLTTTCGLGRVAQANGTEQDENQYIEFAVELPTHARQIAGAVGVLALMVHLKDPGSGPIGPCHRAAAHNIPFPYEWVVYDSLPALDLGGSSPIRLFQPLLMSASERERVPLGQNRDWIEAHRAKALPRWLEPAVSSGDDKAV